MTAEDHQVAANSDLSQLRRPCGLGSCMTLYLFAGVGVLTYVGGAAIAAYGATGTHVAFALGFTIVVTLWMFDAAAIVLSVSRYTYTWVLLVALGLCAAIAIAKAGTRDASAEVSSAKASFANVASLQLTRARIDGQRLFNDLGCVDCHATGIGPALTHRFGSPVAEGCGGLTVDEAYIRESILNPTAIVATGFSPIMPSFSSKVSESELASLVAYVVSLSTPVGSH